MTQWTIVTGVTVRLDSDANMASLLKKPMWLASITMTSGWVVAA